MGRLVLATAFNLGISALFYAACIQWGVNGAIAVIAATVASATMWACILGDASKQVLHVMALGARRMAETD